MSTANPASASRLPEAAFAAVPADSGSGALNNVLAIAGVSLKELYRRKDFYVLFVLTALITLVMGSVNIFNQEGVVRYLKEFCLFLIWASSLVITVTATARQLPAERESRTLFPLLAKPVSRTQVVAGKFLGCWLASGVALALFYVFFGAMAAVQERHWPLAHHFQALTLHWAALGIVGAMAMLGSVVFAAPSSNNTITLVICTAILYLGGHLNKVALRLSEPSQTVLQAAYFTLPHLEWFDVRSLIVHEGPLVPWLVWAGALGYAAAYTACFLAAACFVFRRKAVN
jgi:Cu-processing system permease protein